MSVRAGDRAPQPYCAGAPVLPAPAAAAAALAGLGFGDVSVMFDAATPRARTRALVRRTAGQHLEERIPSSTEDTDRYHSFLVLHEIRYGLCL
jgi:hypothetical protein